MKKTIVSIATITAVFLLSTGSVHGQTTTGKSNSDINIHQNLSSMILLAHHIGNRPDDAPDIEDNVHGGDYDPGWDPNGDVPPEPGRPDNDPETVNG